MAPGSGSICSPVTARAQRIAPSSLLMPGRTATVRATAAASSGGTDHAYVPASAKTAHAEIATSAAAARRSARLCVVVLVLVAVVAGIVVLVPREIDPVQQDRHLLGPGRQDGLERTLRVAA